MPNKFVNPDTMAKELADAINKNAEGLNEEERRQYFHFVELWFGQLGGFPNASSERK